MHTFTISRKLIQIILLLARLALARLADPCWLYTELLTEMHAPDSLLGKTTCLVVLATRVELDHVGSDLPDRAPQTLLSHARPSVSPLLLLTGYHIDECKSGLCEHFVSI